MKKTQNKKTTPASVCEDAKYVELRKELDELGEQIKDNAVLFLKIISDNEKQIEKLKAELFIKNHQYNQLWEDFKELCSEKITPILG